MRKLIIRGGKPLYGDVNISGMKNSALPVIFGTIVANDICTIKNLPDVSDISLALRTLETIGAEVRFTDTSTANWIENNCKAGLFRRNLTPKPAALMLKKLFCEVWHTELEAETDDNGYLTFRGFFGDYEASFDGGTMSFEHRKK